MRLNKFSCLIVAGLILLATSCKKEESAITTAENAVPIANAGLSAIITLPVDSVNLAGSGTDTDGTVVAYLWSQVAGPAATTIVNPGAPATKAKGLIRGNYIFQLMVTDNKGATGVDTMSVVVNPSPITTLTTQPANNQGEFMFCNNGGVDQSGGSRPDMPIEAWTNGGNPYTIRGIIKFDLSSIPSSATVLSANLYLYSYPPPTLNGNFTDANFGSNNALLVQRVTSNWSAGTANWFNQPSVTTTNQVIAPHTTSSQLDLNLDVTSMVSSMVNGGANYGFFLKLQNEVAYTSRIFVASYNATYTTKYPKLVVVYQ